MSDTANQQRRPTIAELEAILENKEPVPIEILPSGEVVVGPMDLEHALASALNRYCAENASNTPDWILAQFLLGCLAAWNQGVQQRETWYGRDARPASAPSMPPSGPPVPLTPITDPA